MFDERVKSPLDTCHARLSADRAWDGAHPAEERSGEPRTGTRVGKRWLWQTLPMLALLAFSSQLASCQGQPTPGHGAQSPAANPVDRLAGSLSETVATREPTRPPGPTALASATPSPTPLHPLSIAAMRARAYPGSDLHVERQLAPGPGYSRAIVSYRSDGLKQYALLTVPDGDRPPTGWPVIVFNHGYIPPAQYRTAERYVAYVDYFARRGYMVLKPDYRGHGDSEGEANGGYGSPDYTVDVLNGLAAVRRHPDADPERIGMWGHSMGGYITLRAMVVTDTLRAGVIWAGVVASYPDLLAHWHRRSAGSGPTPPPRAGSWRQSLVQRYGAPEDNPAFWESISSNTYVDEISGPLQLHHGTGDTSVPILFSQLLEQQLERAGQTVELYTYEDDDHNLSRSFGLAMQRSAAFFDRYVKAAP